MGETTVLPNSLNSESKRVSGHSGQHCDKMCNTFNVNLGSQKYFKQTTSFYKVPPEKCG